MKFEYIKPELDIINLSDEDIIVTSQMTDGGDQGEGSKEPGGDFDSWWG